MARPPRGFRRHADESTPPLSANVSAAFLGLNIAIVTGSMYFALRYFADQRDQTMTELNRQHMLVQLEQTRSEGLLLSILPRPVAERLKHDPRATAEGYADVTVLFADIVDFTRMSCRRLGRAGPRHAR